MARLRNAPSTQNTQLAKATRPALKDRTNTAKTQVQVYENDGDADPLVKDARPRRGRAKKAVQDEDEFVMAGGLGNRDGGETAVAQSEESVPAAKTRKRPSPTTRTAVQSRMQSAAQNGAKKRAQAPMRKAVLSKKDRDLPDDEIIVSSSEAMIAKPRSPRKLDQSRRERSDFSLSPSPPPAGKLNSVKRSSLNQPGSALRSHGAPAMESSILALKNFKRRPRQPSMLQMVQQRTASARPSAVNTNTSERPDEFDFDAGLDDEETFAPDAEGTPMLKKTRMQAAGSKRVSGNEAPESVAVIQQAAPTRKRRSEETGDSFSALDALRAKRHKISGPHEAAILTSATGRGSSSGERRTPPPELTSDVQVIHSSSSTPPSDPPSPEPRYASQDPDEAVPSTEKEQDSAVQRNPATQQNNDVEDDIPNGTMADPVSSPIPSSPPPMDATQQTDIMADPLTQISPPRPKPRESKKEKRAKPLDTATLQALLPKRRKPLQPRQRKSEYDMISESEEDNDGPIDTSHLEDDEDELSGRARRKTKANIAAKSRKSTAVISKAAPLSRKSNAPASRKGTRKSKPAKVPSKTYGRVAASDKENENVDDFEDAEEDDSVLPDTSISMYEAAKSTELEAIKQKFAELDDWEMEFESVTVEEGRSSSQLWR